MNFSRDSNHKADNETEDSGTISRWNPYECLYPEIVSKGSFSVGWIDSAFYGDKRNTLSLWDHTTSNPEDVQAAKGHSLSADKRTSFCKLLQLDGSMNIPHWSTESNCPSVAGKRILYVKVVFSIFKDLPKDLKVHWVTCFTWYPAFLYGRRIPFERFVVYIAALVTCFSNQTSWMMTVYRR